MMRQANDVKEALTGRQSNFSFPSLSSFLFLACSYDILLVIVIDFSLFGNEQKRLLKLCVKR